MKIYVLFFSRVADSVSHVLWGYYGKRIMIGIVHKNKITICPT
jgi:hypothetical protein